MANRKALTIGSGGMPTELAETDELNGQVSYGIAQTLTEAQKRRARLNIAAFACASVLAYGADPSGATDSTAAFRACAAAEGFWYIEEGQYTIDTTAGGFIAHKQGARIWGVSRAGVYIYNNSNTQYAFGYESAIQAGSYDVQFSPHLEAFTLDSKFGIRWNQSGDFSTVFDKQGALIKPRIVDVRFIGRYGAAGNTDASAGTATAVTQTTLEGFGVSLKAAKLFEAKIQDCIFDSAGCAISFDGCDGNIIEGCRFNSCGRWVYIYRDPNTPIYNTYSGRNRITSAFCSNNRRIGGIYLENALYTQISRLYVETYSAAGMYIDSSGDIGTLIEGVSVDDPSQSSTPTTPMFRFAPARGMQCRNWTFQKNFNAASIQFLTTHYSSQFPCLMEWGPHEPGVPDPSGVGWRRHTWQRSAFAVDNLPDVSISGTVGSSWFWELDATTGGYNIRTDQGASTIYIPLFPPFPCDKIDLIVTGRKIGAGSGGWANITWGGTSVYGGFLNLDNSSEVQQKRITLTRPSGKLWTDILQVEVTPSEARYFRFELAAVASPSGGGSGDMTKAVYDSNNDGRIDPAALGTGTASASTFLRGDGTWATPAGGGGSSSPNVVFASSSASVDLGTTEAQVASLTITPSSPSAYIKVSAIGNANKDATTGAVFVTLRVRRGTTNSDTQVGTDGLSNTTQSTSTAPNAGPVQVLGIDQPGTTGAVTYTLRALGTSTAANLAGYTFIVEEVH